MGDFNQAPDLARQIADLASRLSALERTQPFVSSERSIRIVRGVVSSVGVIVAGEGYSVTYNGTGDYTLTFDPEFSARPAVVVTPIQIGGQLRMAVEHNASLATGGSYRLLTGSNATTAADAPFHFTAEGPA